MKQKQRFISFLLAWLMVATFGYAIALPQLQDDKKKTHTSTAQPVQLDEDTIPDSLLHTRWQIQRTQPYSLSDLYQSPLDLKRPDNLQYQVVYNDTLDRYIIGNRMGSTWLSAPLMLTPKEYLAWTEQQQRNSYFRKQNDEIFQAKGKEKFDFSDMHFDLGPAEKNLWSWWHQSEDTRFCRTQVRYQQEEHRQSFVAYPQPKDDDDGF